MTKKNLQKLISLTFDEAPEVRKKAAKDISDLNDPGALFALLELTYDKDESVKETAKKLLEKKDSTQPELLSLSELFSYKPPSKKESKKEDEKVPKDKKKKLLYPIELLFEKHLGKERAEVVKKKMMPSLEKVYLKSTSGKNSVTNDERKEAVQEFLTTYLDAISDKPSAKAEPEEPVDSLETLEHVSTKVSLDDRKVDNIIHEADEFTEEISEDKQHEQFLETAPDTLFKKAYEIMMYSGGDSKLMKKEMKRMIKNAEKDIRMAFKLAQNRFKENKVTKLTDIKEKMRNITTDDLTICLKETIEFKKPRSTKIALRFLLNDSEENEGVLYLFNGRGQDLEQGMKVKIHKAYAKIINDETALVIGKQGNVYIVV